MMTATEQYQINQAEIEKLIKQLQSKLRNHATIFKRKEKGWSYVADLTYVKAGLNDLNMFLK